MDTVTRPADEVSDLHYLDARDYRLVILVENDGRVVVEHPHNQAVARKRMTYLAAEIVDEVGQAAVDAALGKRAPVGTPITTPPAGIALMPCRCGRMLSAADMHRARPRYGMAGPVIAPIVCARCALS